MVEGVAAFVESEPRGGGGEQARGMANVVVGLRKPVGVGLWRGPGESLESTIELLDTVIEHGFHICYLRLLSWPSTVEGWHDPIFLA